jgi:hygromycin-B 4-O-kinase
MEPTPINEQMVEAIAEHHFGKKPKKITPLTGGLSNFVYEVIMSEKDQYVIRLCDVPQKLNYFLKEQWAVAQARERGIPVPEILEVGNEIIEHPYMVVRKVTGQDGTNHPDRIKILQQLGKYASLIHTIPTNGFGHVFDWSNNTLSKRETWKDYMEKDWQRKDKLAILETNEMLNKDNLKKLKHALKEMEAWDIAPKLNHSDLRLKNTLVDADGKIVCLLDWENCESNIAPYWDLSIALHDLTIDEKEVFLDGYGMRPKDFQTMAPWMKIINLMNYAPHIAHMVEQKDQKKLEKYRLRLNGYFDLYSL